MPWTAPLFIDALMEPARALAICSLLTLAMSLVLHAGGAPLIAFWWWEPPARGARLAFTSRAEARAFLARLRAEPEGARGLRRLLASRQGATPSRLDDGEVIEQLAHLLSAGQLRSAAKAREPLTACDEGAEESEPPRFLVAAPPPVVEVARAVAPVTFEETIDAEVLAAALKEAARQGVPFCEECHKDAVRKQREDAAKAKSAARAKARPAPAPVPETFSPDVDAEAMAEAMKAAARDGVPFCEVCMKKELEAKRAAKAKAKAGAKGAGR